MESRHYITSEILRLIRQAIADYQGSKAAFCRVSGISPSSLSRILSGQRKFIYAGDWQRLVDFFPELEAKEAMVVEGTANAVGDNNIIYNGGGGIEDFRSALIGELISADIDPVELQKVLRIINTFRKGN